MSGSVYDYIDDTGVIVPDTGSLQAEVISEWQAVFGAGLSTDQSTIQGTLIAAEVAARVGVVGNNAQIANQINPNVSEGVFLDAICALSGLTREAETYTTAAGVILTGVPGTTVPAGSLADTPAGDQFALAADVSLVLSGGTGMGTGTFVAVQPGAVPAPAGTWNIVAGGVLGWETVTNPAVATPGTVQQADELLRALRLNTLALQSQGLRISMVAALYALPGVVGVQSIENNTSSNLTVNGYTVSSRNLWVCVDGGVPTAIANALLTGKSTGAGWQGAQAVTVVEPASGQSYTVNYDIPTLVPLAVQVTVNQGTFVGALAAAVTQAVVDFANNAIANLQGFVVGVNASPFEIAAGINAECQGVHIKSVQISLLSTINFQPTEIAMLIYQKATVTASNVTVNVV